MMPHESADMKARRYLVEGRIVVTRVVPGAVDARARGDAADNDMSVDEAVRHLAVIGLANQQSSLAGMFAVGGWLAADAMRREAIRLECWFDAAERKSKEGTQIDTPGERLAEVVQLDSARRAI